MYSARLFTSRVLNVFWGFWLQLYLILGHMKRERLVHLAVPREGSVCKIKMVPEVVQVVGEVSSFHRFDARESGS